MEWNRGIRYSILLNTTQSCLIIGLVDCITKGFLQSRRAKLYDVQIIFGHLFTHVIIQLFAISSPHPLISSSRHFLFRFVSFPFVSFRFLSSPLQNRS